MSRVIMRTHGKEEYGSLGTGCLHRIDQEVLTDRGQRIEFPPGGKGFFGEPLYAIVVSKGLHFPHDNDNCEVTEQKMLKEHLKTLAMVMERVKPVLVEGEVAP